MFGFEHEITKGYYPHLFNTRENENYIYLYPDIKYYNPEILQPEAYKKLFDWWYERKSKCFIFDNQKELARYCHDDVTILRRAVFAFRDCFLKITDNKFDPFSYLTLAQLAVNIWRNGCMPENTVGILQSLTKSQNASIKENQWLDYIVHTTSAKLVMDLDGKRNYKLKYLHIYVDGYDKDTNTVYEFLGSWFHADLTKYHKDDIQYQQGRRSGMTFGEVNRQTMKRLKDIKGAGYNLVYTWESEWDIQVAQLKNSEVGTAFLNRQKIASPITDRDSYHGARVDLGKLFYKSKGNEYIRYQDFNSMYPSVMKTKRFPKGHPEIIRDVKSLDIHGYFGLIKCKVQPPSHLKFGVLPYVTNKLIFPLYEMIGTWTTVELEKAIEKGYKILDIYEIKHWKETSTDLFAGYINKFLKLKTESSGPPDSDINTFIKDFEFHEGIKLDKRNLKFNPGMRQVAKDMQNILYGKLGERSNKAKSKVIQNPGEFYNTISNKRYDCKYEFIGSEENEMVLMNFTENSEVFADTRFSTNEVLAAFITSYGRLKLYELMEVVGYDNVLYFDTDSIIYTETEENYHVYHGTGYRQPWLGYLKCELQELEKEHGKCVEFLSTGPKSYSLKFSDGYCMTKIKGFSLSVDNLQHINHDVMKDMILNQRNEPVKMNNLVIRHVSNSLALEVRSE
eukprot:gene16494-19584_t